MTGATQASQKWVGECSSVRDLADLKSSCEPQNRPGKADDCSQKGIWNMAPRAHFFLSFSAQGAYWTWCDQEWVGEPGKRCWVGAHVMTRPPPLILLLNCAFTCSLPPLLLFQHHHNCHRYHHSILAIIISFLKVMFTKPHNIRHLIILFQLIIITSCHMTGHPFHCA